MADTVQQGFLFLINTLFNLYLFVLVVRLLLVYVGANYFDPVTQFVVRLTDILVKPVRRYIPNFRRIETSTLLIIVVMELVKFSIITLLALGAPNVLGVLVLSIADVLRIVLDTLFYAIIIQVILSWVQPFSPVSQLLVQMTAPLMTPIRRMIPPIAGIDISPLFAIILIQFIHLILVQTLLQAGWGMTA